MVVGGGRGAGIENSLRSGARVCADGILTLASESFFSTLEAELLSRRRFASQAEARMACFSYIESWYNTVRLHSALGYRSPMAYEADMQSTVTDA